MNKSNKFSREVCERAHVPRMEHQLMQTIFGLAHLVLMTVEDFDQSVNPLVSSGVGSIW